MVDLLIMKNFKQIAIVMPILFMIGITICNAQNVECSDLMKHRSEILSKYLAKKKLYKIRNEHINDIRQIKQDLIDNNDYSTSSTLTIIMGIKTANDIVDGILSMVPANQLKKMSLKSYEILINVKNIKNIQDISQSENLAEFAMNTAKTIELDNIGFMLYDLKKNLDNFKQQKILKQEIINQILNIEKEITYYNSRLMDTDSSKKELKNYINAIDKYLKENCEQEVKENPIDIESMLWKTKKSNINIEDYSYNISEMLNNPEFAQYFDFNDQFMNELTQLISRIDYNSEASINNYIKQLEHLMEKYIKKTNNNNSNNVKSKIIQPKKRKATTARNISSYANFKENRTSNSSGIKRAKVNRSNNNFKPKSCGHSASWHKKNGTCASEQ